MKTFTHSGSGSAARSRAACEALPEASASAAHCVAAAAIPTFRVVTVFPSPGSGLVMSTLARCASLEAISIHWAMRR